MSTRCWIIRFSCNIEYKHIIIVFQTKPKLKRLHNFPAWIHDIMFEVMWTQSISNEYFVFFRCDFTRNSIKIQVIWQVNFSCYWLNCISNYLFVNFKTSYISSKMLDMWPFCIKSDQSGLGTPCGNEWNWWYSYRHTKDLQLEPGSVTGAASLKNAHIKHRYNSKIKYTVSDIFLFWINSSFTYLVRGPW